MPQLLIACLATTHEHLHGHSSFAVATFTHQKTVHQKWGHRHGHCLSVATFKKTGDLKSTLSLLLQHFKNGETGKDSVVLIPMLGSSYGLSRCCDISKTAKLILGTLSLLFQHFKNGESGKDSVVLTQTLGSTYGL